MDRKVWIGSIPASVSETNLHECMCRFGDVVEIFYKQDKNITNSISSNNKNRGWAFVTFQYPEDAQNMINAVNDSFFFEGCEKPVEARFADNNGTSNSNFDNINYNTSYSSNQHEGGMGGERNEERSGVSRIANRNKGNNNNANIENNMMNSNSDGFNNHSQQHANMNYNNSFFDNNDNYNNYNSYNITHFNNNDNYGYNSCNTNNSNGNYNNENFSSNYSNYNFSSNYNSSINDNSNNNNQSSNMHSLLSNPPPGVEKKIVINNDVNKINFASLSLNTESDSMFDASVGQLSPSSLLRGVQTPRHYQQNNNRQHHFQVHNSNMNNNNMNTNNDGNININNNGSSNYSYNSTSVSENNTSSQNNPNISNNNDNNSNKIKNRKNNNSSGSANHRHNISLPHPPPPPPSSSSLPSSIKNPHLQYPKPTVEGPPLWQIYHTPEGYPYFYNSVSGHVQWKKPLPPKEYVESIGAPHVQHTSLSSRTNMKGFGPPGANLFLFHLPSEWTDANLMEHFTPFGTIVSCRIQTDASSGRNSGFGFVSYDTPASALAAIKLMNGYGVSGKFLKVQLKKGEEHLLPPDMQQA